jgi:hypothetical protein
LSFTVTERPVFLSDLYQVDEYILVPQSKALVKTICYRFVKALFLFDGSPFVERQLDELQPCVGIIEGRAGFGVLSRERSQN